MHLVGMFCANNSSVFSINQKNAGGVYGRNVRNRNRQYIRLRQYRNSRNHQCLKHNRDKRGKVEEHKKFDLLYRLRLLLRKECFHHLMSMERRVVRQALYLRNAEMTQKIHTDSIFILF